MKTKWVMVLVMIVLTFLAGLISMLLSNPASGQVCIECPPDMVGAMCSFDEDGNLVFEGSYVGGVACCVNATGHQPSEVVLPLPCSPEIIETPPWSPISPPTARRAVNRTLFPIICK